jgi:hypothetical protein
MLVHARLMSKCVKGFRVTAIRHTGKLQLLLWVLMRLGLDESVNSLLGSRASPPALSAEREKGW